MNRVAITGIGVLSPIGHTAGQFASSLKEGVCGIGPITNISQEGLIITVAAEVRNIDLAQHLDPKRMPMLDRFSQLALIAAREAVTDSGLNFKADETLARRTATITGSGVGGQLTLEESYRRLWHQGAARVHPLTVPKLMINAATSQISMEHGLKGPAFTIGSACASATHAIGVAFQMVRSGMVDAAITGGSEACIAYGTIKGWEALRVMAPDVCRPFSKGRSGMTLGEGAGILVIENMDRARQRGAKIYAEIAGFGMTADAADITTPDLTGASRAISEAIADAKLAPEDISYVNAHGTGTAVNDTMETRALHAVFGPHARSLAISSNKSQFGHALGGAGALEAIATAIAIRDGFVPPTLNYLERDPDCDLDYTPNQARDLTIKAAISNSFAFGGLNAVLAIKAV